MGNKKAHVFQHCCSGLNTIEWIYLGEKTAEDAS